MVTFIPLFAYLCDLCFGDPDWIYKRIWHPVVVPGKLASWFEQKFNTQSASKKSIYVGTLSTLAIILSVLLLTLALVYLFRLIPYAGWLLEVLLASTLIAHKSLAKFVSNVGTSLTTDGLTGGQKAVQHLVSRKAEALDESGVCRSAIESLAENFSDAVIAPLFWFVVFGLPGLAVYKTINTLDSMWGYRSERYEYFGKFAARLDDLVNLVPARLSAFIVLAAANKLNLYQEVIRNAPLHRSPNAGWPESAFAYVLGIKLSGPRLYDEGSYDGPWMGAEKEGREELNAIDIDKSVALFNSTIKVVVVLLVLACALKYII